jgi:hypothetical protein
MAMAKTQPSFSDAPVINAGANQTGKGRKPIQMPMFGIQDLVMLIAVRDELNEKINAKTIELKLAADEVFITEGCALKARPANILGVDGLVKKLFQLKKRSVNSALTPQQVADLRKANIPTHTLTDIIETYVFNPEYLGNQKALAAAAKALSKAPDVPKNFIMKQKGETRTVITDDSVRVLFQKPKEIVAKLFHIICNVAADNTEYEGPLAIACLRAWDILNPPSRLGKTAPKRRAI